MTGALAAVLTLGLLQPTPQSAAPPAPGTAVLRGRVVDKASGEPLPFAVVLLRNMRETRSQQQSTDDRGGFEFRGVAAGSYELLASAGLYRATHTPTAYGQTGSGNLALNIRDGEERADLVIALPRAFAINGRVLDESGHPLANVSINLRERSGRGGGSSGPRNTDDRGIFRVHGLPPGTYKVCAEIRSMPTLAATSRRTQLYEPTCYANATDPADATDVVLSDADVDGIEIRLPRRPTYTVSGFVMTPQGGPPENATISVTRFDGNGTSGTGGQLLPGGTFSLSNVRAGSYEISVRLGRNNRGGPQADDREPLWGSANVEVSTADVDGLVIVMKPGVSLKGRVSFEDPPESPVGGPLRITPRPARGGGDRPTVAPATVADNGTFELKGLFGPVTLGIDGSLPRGYVLKSMMYRGRDIAHASVEFDGNPAHEIEIVLTNRTAELSGRVVDESGKPVLRGSIVRFPADPAKWKSYYNWSGPGIRQNGTYQLTQIPAGEYFVAAVTSEQMAGLSFPDDFDRIAAIAERVTVFDNDRRTADLTLRTVPPRRKR